MTDIDSICLELPEPIEAEPGKIRIDADDLDELHEDVLGRPGQSAADGDADELFVGQSAHTLQIQRFFHFVWVDPQTQTAAEEPLLRFQNAETRPVCHLWLFRGMTGFLL